MFTVGSEVIANKARIEEQDRRAEAFRHRPATVFLLAFLPGCSRSNLFQWLAAKDVKLSEE
jgi:hypothetical protein